MCAFNALMYLTFAVDSSSLARFFFIFSFCFFTFYIVYDLRESNIDTKLNFEILLAT